MTIPSIDLHQDILLHQREPQMYPEGYRNQTSFEQLQSADVRLVLGTGFPLPDNENHFDESANDLIEKDINSYHSIVEQRDNWQLVTESDEVSEVLNNETGTSGILLHVEGLNVFSGTQEGWSRLERWYEKGWRSVGIVWNKSNALGGGTEDEDGGLTDLGKDFLVWAQDKNMVIDLAHMNPPTFSDTLDVTEGPLIISHGNAKNLVDTNRNYSDAQLKAVAERGGVAGVFFSSKNLSDSSVTIKDVVNHISYMTSLMGVDHVSIGTDFGGLLGEKVSGLERIDQLSNLWEKLLDSGFEKDEVEKIAYKNASRVLQSILS